MPIIDWFTAAHGQGWIGGDRVHLGAVGYQARADLVASAVRPR